LQAQHIPKQHPAKHKKLPTAMPAMTAGGRARAAASKLLQYCHHVRVTVRVTVEVDPGAVDAVKFPGYSCPVRPAYSMSVGAAKAVASALFNVATA